MNELFFAPHENLINLSGEFPEFFETLTIMSSPRLGEAVDGNQEKFPPVDVEGSVNPAANNNGLQVDPVSSQMATSKELKEKAEADEKIQKKKEKECAAHTLKSAIIISGVVVAVIGAIFAVTKKLREKH